MKVSVSPKDLSKALKLMSGLFPSGQEVVCVFKAADKKLKILSEDQGVYVSSDVPATVHTSGEFSLDISYLMALKFGGKEVILESTSKLVNFKSGRFRGKLNCMVKPQKFSKLASIPLKYTFDLDRFKEGYTAMDYDSNILLEDSKYIQVTLKGKTLRFNTNDSYSLGMFTTEHPKMPDDFDMIIPDEIISKILPNLENSFELGVAKEAIRIRTSSLEVYHPIVAQSTARKESKLVDANSRIEDIRKKKPEAVVFLEAKAASEALDAVTSFLMGNDEKIEVHLKEGTCYLSVTSTYGAAKDSFKVKCKAKDYKTKLSSLLLGQFLSKCEAKAKISLYGILALIESENKTYVMSTLNK